MCQVERLQRKFATIHSTLAQQQTQKAPDPPASPLRSSVPSVADSLPKVPSLSPYVLWCFEDEFSQKEALTFVTRFSVTFLV